MAYTVESRTNTPANALRDALDQAERQVVTVDASNVEDFLVSLDRIHQMFNELEQSNMDVRPEETRWQSLLNRTSRQRSGRHGCAARQASTSKRVVVAH
jgi:hypothetical protein